VATGIANPNGVSSTLTYDLADRLTRITHAQRMTTLEDIQYVVNAVGNRTSMTDSAGTTTWTYDNLDRLTNVSYPNGDMVAYGYDKVGNRISHTVNGTPKTNTFDDADRMTASGTDTYTYDANGNQTGKTVGSVTTTYTYDPLDRLTGISGPVTASYASNGDGLRVSKTVGGATTRFTWDVLGIGQVIGDGNEYVWGVGLISQVTVGGTATYAQQDGLGSVRLLTDAMGAAVGTKQYDAFGAARSTIGVTLPFGYTGEQEDAESGLVYLRARHLDPNSGRFTSLDLIPGTLEDPLTQNAYTYAENDPVNRVDPTGLSSCMAFRIPWPPKLPWSLPTKCGACKSVCQNAINNVTGIAACGMLCWGVMGPTAYSICMGACTTGNAVIPPGPGSVLICRFVCRGVCSKGPAPVRFEPVT
jgi:RHS repeat-associated protein